MAALESLQSKSIAIFRKHLGSYALWEGSDIDIEARLEEARRQVDRDQPMAAFLMQTLPPQPMIARRHYFQKGTLRYFDVCYADRGTLEQELARDLGQADGRIVFCLPMNAEERKAMGALRKSSPGFATPSVVAALPHDALDLTEYCLELLCLRWVLQVCRSYRAALAFTWRRRRLRRGRRAAMRVQRSTARGVPNRSKAAWCHGIRRPAPRRYTARSWTGGSRSGVNSSAIRPRMDCLVPTTSGGSTTSRPCSCRARPIVRSIGRRRRARTKSMARSGQNGPRWDGRTCVSLSN